MNISNFLSGNDKYIEYIEIFKNSRLNNGCGKYFSLNGSKQNKVIKNDILVTNTSETINEIGMSSIYNGDNGKYLNSFCFILRNECFNIDSEYVNFLLNSPIYRKLIVRLGQGSTRYNLSKNEYAKINLKLPSLIEQHKITKFFALLDKQIELWERKLQLNELIKKYYLNQVFTNNCNIPKLRFKEFDNNPYIWNYLSEISTVLGAGIDKKLDINEKKIMLINFMDVFKNSSIHNNIKLINCSCKEWEYDKYKIFNADILITPSSENKTDIGISSIINLSSVENIVYSYHLNLIRINSNIINSSYVQSQLSTKRIKKYFYNVSQGGTRFTLSINDLNNLYIGYSSLLEQEKIAIFLNTLDNVTQFIKKISDLLKNKKKFYLKNLFI